MKLVCIIRVTGTLPQEHCHNEIGTETSHPLSENYSHPVMGTPAQYLAGRIDEASIKALMVSIGLPPPLLIVFPIVTAQYHGIYFITVPHNGQASPRKLVLRVSGNHVPHIKTANEVAILSWIAQNTTIPVPELVSHDSTANNRIGHEYTLLTHVPGVILSDVWQSLDEGEICSIIDQLIDILVQLHAHG